MTGDKPDPRATTAVDKHIGAAMRARRAVINMSQEQLAGAIGVTFQQVQKYEKGTNRVSASTLMEIARALDVKVSAFFAGIADAEDGAGTILGENLQELTLTYARLNERGRDIVLSVAKAFAAQSEYQGKPPSHESLTN